MREIVLALTGCVLLASCQRHAAPPTLPPSPSPPPLKSGIRGHIGARSLPGVQMPEPATPGPEVDEPGREVRIFRNTSEPLPGDPEPEPVAVATTDAGGRFVVDLPPGTYQVKAGTQEIVTVHPGVYATMEMHDIIARP